MKAVAFAMLAFVAMTASGFDRVVVIEDAYAEY